MRVLLLLLVAAAATDAKFKVIREWRYVNFTWPDAATYGTAVAKAAYVPENNTVAGLKHYDDFYYLTLPRMKPGVPATLARIPAGSTVSDTAPLLEPYPSWEMNALGDCNALQNVQNVEVDARGQLWVIDGGRVQTLGAAPVAKCRPKLVVFDANGKKMTMTYTFPEDVASMDGSFLYDLVVDDTDGGFVYITDNSGRDPGIIVFSVTESRAWKIRHTESMKADPAAVTFRVNSVTVRAPINIAGIALGPKIRMDNGRLIVSDDREVYYAPLSSLHLYSISTSVLKNEMNGRGEYQGNVKDYGLKSSQSIAMIMDNQGVLYYSLLASNSISRWDTKTPFQTGQRIIARDEKFLEWPHSFCFDNNGNITVLVNKLNKFIYDSVDINEPNFRLITADVGGKSYLYEDNYQYENANSESTSTSVGTSTRSSSSTEKIMPPHASDQDPYLGIQNDARPESTMQHNQGSMEIDRSDTSHENSIDFGHDSSTTKKTTSNAIKIAGSLVSILLAVIIVI